jgi:uncharacterized protein YbjQ (UPF0145 family)
MNCPNCGVPLMGGMVICPKCKFDSRTTDGGEGFRKYNELKEKQRIEEEERLRAEEEAAIKAGNRDAIRGKLRKELVLTSCPSVEGFRIKKQCGLVFGEVAFKTGFFKSLGATIDNFVDILSSGDKELSGTARLLSNARDYAITKLMDEAIDRDANAIVGIDAESSVGLDIIHITIYGTAVEIEKIDA